MAAPIDPLSLVPSLLASLRDPIAALALPDKRIFLPHLVGAGAIAALVWWRHLRGKRSLLGWMFPARVWWHRSAREDYALLFVRAALRALFLAPLAIATVPLAARICARLTETFGSAGPASLSGAQVGALFTVVAFVADDLGRYVLHYLAHRVPVLWELHKVHHSAEVMTPFTVHRVHPIEAWLNGLRGAATTAVVAGVLAWAFPGRIRGWEILGVDALGFLWTVTGANLRHSHVWLSYGRVLEHVLISPAQHQIHHSQEPHHHDRNFGSAFALWDWLFGTLYVTRGREDLRFGLPRALRNHRPGVVWMLVDPLLAIARMALPAALTRRLRPERSS